MKILITGHKGYIGSHLTQHLSDWHDLEDPFEIEGFDKGDPFPTLRGRYDAVIQCAANAESQYDKPDIFDTNYDLTKRIAETAAKLLFFSSAMAKHPVNWYGRSKRCAEDYLLLKRPATTTIVRPFQVYGGTEPSHRKSFMRKLLDGEVEYLFRDYTRDFIHINDVCRAIFLILRQNLWGQIYDLGTSAPVTAMELYEIVRGKVREPEIVDATDVLSMEISASVLPEKEQMIPDFVATIDVKQWMREISQK